MKETVTISREEYAQLLKDKYKLEALECGGVDNWEWYDYALDDYWQDEFKEHKKEIEEYAATTGYEFESENRCEYEDIKFIETYLIRKAVERAKRLEKED